MEHEELMKHYDKIIYWSSLIAMIGLIVGAAGVFVFRHYSGLKTKQSFSKIDSEFKNTITEIQTQKDIIKQKIQDETNSIITELKESSKDASDAINNLKDESIKATSIISEQVETYGNLINFNNISFHLNAEIDDLRLQIIEDYNKRRSKRDFILRVQFHQKINDEELRLEYVAAIDNYLELFDPYEVGVGKATIRNKSFTEIQNNKLPKWYNGELK